MRAPPPREQRSGAEERSPTRRPADVPDDQGGEALVEHLVDRLAGAERELRAARAAAETADRRRALLSHAARAVADRPTAPAVDVVRLALPLLGTWCLVDELKNGEAVRTVAALDAAVERQAARLAGPIDVGPDSPVGLARVLRRGRTERLAALPALGDDQTAEDHDVRRTLAMLAEGALLVVPVLTGGRVSAALTFGRGADEPAYDDADQRVAEDLAAVVALAIEQQRTLEGAASAADAKAQFLTMMSHELRTPLNAIAGYAQLLEMGFRGPLNEGQRDAVLRILRGQEHLLELVDAVLTFSRLTSGRLAIGRGQVRSVLLLDAASEAVVREFAAHGIDFRVLPCRDDLVVSADRDRALEILGHLLGNAAKFTPRGGRVTLGCEGGPGVVRFVVSDTGRGVPEGHRESIFHPFVQAEKGLTRSVDGSGMGLAVGRELAQRMGGSLTVTSELGVGSRFVLTLPRADAGAIEHSIDSPSCEG
jgi:signal transduction histidine kinase